MIIPQILLIIGEARRKMEDFMQIYETLPLGSIIFSDDPIRQRFVKMRVYREGYIVKWGLPVINHNLYQYIL